VGMTRAKEIPDNLFGLKKCVAKRWNCRVLSKKVGKEPVKKTCIGYSMQGFY